MKHKNWLAIGVANSVFRSQFLSVLEFLSTLFYKSSSIFIMSHLSINKHYLKKTFNYIKKGNCIIKSLYFQQIKNYSDITVDTDIMTQASISKGLKGTNLSLSYFKSIKWNLFSYVNEIYLGKNNFLDVTNRRNNGIVSCNSFWNNHLLI